MPIVRVFTIIFLLSFCGAAMAQDAKSTAAENAQAMENMDIASLPNGWVSRADILFGTVLTNNVRWAGASEKYNITSTLNSILRLDGKVGKQVYNNDLNIVLGGVVSEGTKGQFRKAQDVLMMNSTVATQLIPKWFAAARASLTSQVLASYEYDGSGVATNVSSMFLSPGVLRAGVGFLHRPKPAYKIYLSPITANCNTKLYPTFFAQEKFGVEAGKTVRMGIGALASAEYNTFFFKKLMYKSKLDLFTDYTRNPFKVIDTDWINSLSIALNKRVSISGLFNFRYYHFIDPHLQFMETIGLSGSYSMQKPAKS